MSEDLSKVKELVVPHSPAPELHIYVEKRNYRWCAWVNTTPKLWEHGDTWAQAVGYLMLSLASIETAISLDVME